MSSEKSLVKDFHTLMKNIQSFSDGQATVSNWDDENLETFEVTIAPTDGLYSEGEFKFEIHASSYPEPPRVYCKTAIYHPNIDTISDPDGELCLNLFDDDMWSDSLGLEDVVQGLLFLLYNPNLEDPLCSQVSSMDEDDFERLVKISVAGGRVENYQFPVNARYARLHLAEGDDSKRNESERKGENSEENTNDRREGDEQTDETEREDGGEKAGEACSKDSGKVGVKKEEQVIKRFFGITEIVSDVEDEDEDEDDFLGDEEEENITDDEEEGDEADIDCDSIVVNDEDLEELFDLVNDQDEMVDDENQKNLEDLETIISWSKMIYGTANRNSTGNSHSAFIEEKMACPANSTTCSLPSSLGPGASKEPGLAPDNGSSPPRTTCTCMRRPTVMSRFVLALRTRNFRRWLV